jgi:CRP-like cAMP-binding protein
MLERVELRVGQVLCESGMAIGHAHFPDTAVVSLEHLTASGACAEIAVVGCEGLVGIPLFMGDGTSPGRAVVQVAGSGYRMPGRVLQLEFHRSTAVMDLLLRYTQALIVHMAQTAVCNRHHRVEEQLCRWLLLVLDRLGGQEIVATHEQIAHMLGVRREGVTAAALALQREGAISYRRGHVTVLDRARLQHRCCECYGVVKAEYDRLLPLPEAS